MNFTERHRFPIEKDLSGLVAILQQVGVDFHITEHEGSQVLYVREDISDAELLAWLNDWKNGVRPVAYPGARVDAEADQRAGVFSDWWRFPLTLLLLGLSVVGYFSVRTSLFFPLLHWLSFQDFTIQSQQLVFLPTDYWQQPWRLLTPVFIHMSLMHIVFNGLWLLELGRRIEVSQSAGRLLFVVVSSALFSNASQFWYMQQGGDPALFGGMSGVIYAFVGYCWIYSALRPVPALMLPKGLIVFMLLWLVLCMSGLVTLLGFGKIANMAHFSGLVWGMATGFFLARVDARNT